MKKPASVHIDIAEFSMTVMELSNNEERGKWVMSLAKCLSYADTSINAYGAKLLNEVNEYRESERIRKERYKEKEEPKGKTRKDTERHGKTEIPSTEQTEQNRQTEQTDIKKVSKDTKKCFGENGKVLLKDEEYQKLVATFGETATKDKIQNLENYILSKGKKYASHYHTILNWERKNEPKSGVDFTNLFGDQK